MLSVYGKRAATIGTHVLMVLCLTLFRHPTGEQVYYNALLLLGGGTWQMALACLVYILRPDRQAGQILIECIRATERSLQIKVASLSNEADGKNEADRKRLREELIKQHVVVTAVHEDLRVMLFNRNGIIDADRRSRERFVIAFVDLVELYDAIICLDEDNAETEAGRIEIGLKGLGTAVPGQLSEGDCRVFMHSPTVSLRLLIDNLNLHSTTFRHAIKVSLTAFSGFVIADSFAHGIHSYWILYTIIFVLKPAYSISKGRIFHRVTGTIVGSGLAVLSIFFIHSEDILFILLMIFLATAYSFLQINYFIFITFVTSSVLLVYSLEGLGGAALVHERLFDNLIGSAAAFLANYLVIPIWEFPFIAGHLARVEAANSNYLRWVIDYTEGRSVDLRSYKMLRNEVYTGLAALKSSFDRMSRDPKRKQRCRCDIGQLISFNFQIMSIAGGLVHRRKKNECGINS